MGILQSQIIQDKAIGVLPESQARSQLVDLFVSNYRVRLANSVELMEEAFRLRYKVYCEERAFESGDNFLNRMESDSFDSHSEHFLIQELATGRYVGTVRLVHSCLNGESVETPISKYCSHAFYNADQFKNLDHRYVEISRFAVTSCSRINLLDTLSGRFSNGQVGRLGYSVASVALAYCCLARFQLIEGLDVAYSMMEPRLAVLLSRMGIKSARVGRPVEYHGTRAPYVWNKQVETTHFNSDQLAFFNTVCHSLQHQFGQNLT
ncbi:MAG: hypothetical protein CSB48_05610 [Proteobacteria bacterium]|nr:MAG: hypothetical protein CSB48_05610 [Pseudomonadota bacterium]